MVQPQKDGDPAEHKEAKKALKEDNSTNNAPGRLVAQELGRGRTSTQKLIKETDFRPLKQVATSHKSKAKRAKRLQMEGELPAAYANVMCTTSIQWSDETWVGEIHVPALARGATASTIIDLAKKILFWRD